jgi:CRP-like cAMP-binding protein
MDSFTTKAMLQQNYLFRSLPEAFIEQVASLATRRVYAKGEIIFRQGDDGDALYGVASGRVRIGASGADGREVFRNIMEPGETFGEIAVMDGLPRTANATALDAATLIVIQRTDFLRLMEREPQLPIHLLGLICERLRWMSELMDEAAFLSGPARLAKRLLSLASLHGRPADGGTELRISQADLAQFLGISRQIVNQHLQEWRKQGWVDLARSRIIVRDPAGLQSVVDRPSSEAAAD